MKSPKDNNLKIVTQLLILASLILRVIFIPHSNHDMAVYNLFWYQTLFEKGISEALATNFSNYTPLYTYFLALATLTHNFIPPLIAIKLIPICFDVLGAFYVYKIIKLKYPHGNIPYLAAAIYFAAPTVILNSSYWGQADSLYTSLSACLLIFSADRKVFCFFVGFRVGFFI